jgi:hypothetical protein
MLPVRIYAYYVGRLLIEQKLPTHKKLVPGICAANLNIERTRR